MKPDVYFALLFTVVAAIITSVTLADIFRLAEVPGVVVAGVAIMGAGALLLAVAAATLIERWPPKHGGRKSK